ncbi:Glucanosyltransferase-domain-containing protein [Lactifluus volemus]|nr:Glucanosyltransferase-domain-containing protein [Lactifluus volemus]
MIFSFSHIALALSLVFQVNAVDIQKVGRYLYSADGTRWYMKGMPTNSRSGKEAAGANAPFAEPTSFTDPLTDGAACQRDAPILQALQSTPSNHDTCMTAFNNAGIYVMYYIKTIDAFSKYNNLLAVNIGNEVITTPQTTSTAPFVKAAARDIKAYLVSKKLNTLVGYAAIDGDDTWIVPLAEFLSCDPSGTNSGSTAIDLYGLNNYEWCGTSTFAASYGAKTTDFANYNVVAYFSEYGCNNPEPRQWQEVAALFGAQAAPVWSGGFAFSYFPATSDSGNFGMVTVNADGTVTPGADFTNLKTAYSQVQFVNVPTQANAPAAAFPACPQVDANFLATTKLPPTPSDSASDTTAILGPLIDGACALLGGKGGNCNGITGNGQTGTYGLAAQCDPAIQASFAMTEWYEANGHNAVACSFAGNGTVNSKASTSSSAAQVASACLSTATGTFVPTLPTAGSSSGGSPGSSSTTGSGNPSSSKSAATTTLLVGDARSLLGVFLMLTVSVAGGLLSLV